MGSLDAIERVALSLPDRVYSQAEVLANPFSFVIGDYAGTAWTPSPYEVGNPKQRLSPPPGAFLWNDSASSSVPTDWGYRNSENSSTIATLCLDFEHPQSNTGESIFPADFPTPARKWATTLHAWLTVLCSGPTDVVADPFLTWMDWNIEVSYLTADRNTWLDPETPLSLGQWKFAVEQANNNTPAPIPLIQIVAARQTHALGEYRSSVINAASAVELAIHHAVVNKLTADRVSDTVQSELLDRRTLGPLIKLAKILGIVLPPTTTSDVVAVRNKVVHAWSDPTEAETRKALMVATQIVRAHYEIDPDLLRALNPLCG